MTKKRYWLSILALIFTLFLFEILFFPFIGKSFDHKRNVTKPFENEADVIKPVIRHPHRIDENFNGIQDSLESLILGEDSKRNTILPVVVTLNNPVTSRDLDLFKMLRGQVTYVYRYVTYGFAGVIPAINIASFTQFEGENLVIVEYDAPITYHLDVSVPNTRARPYVWNTYGLLGSQNHSIAIIDTGIDDSHLDVGPYGDLNFSRKIVGWYDATFDGSLTPEDYGEHGTHVAAIAAGTGIASRLQGSGSIKNTFTYVLPPEVPGPWVYGYRDYIDVMIPGVIKLNCSWGGTNTVWLILSDPAGNMVRDVSGASSPLILTYDTSGKSYPTGRYEVFVGNIEGPEDTPFSCIETYPYQGSNDGYNLFMGMAPNSKLVGVKVFDNTGSGTTSTVMAGMEWVIQNRMTYNITVASMSLGLRYGAVNSTLDQKADTMVNYGIVTTVSAGNEFPDYTIGSPGTAAYVITVAATNDQNNITSYSSDGNSLKNEFGLIKPDVAAPGGTFNKMYGNKILSADSNDVDAGNTGYADRNVDDYQQMAGTSMSTPHVAGLAALVIEALGSWNWTLEEALMVKKIISMTAFEVQSGEMEPESGEINLPPLDRGDKDNVEGYGRICADAAIEALIMNYTIGKSASDTFGSAPSDRKVWARRVFLSAENEYEFHLSVPSGADYDLYLYSDMPDSYGQPVILKRSINATSGADEFIRFTPFDTGVHYILVKWVNGSGTFNLTSVVVKHDVAVVLVKPHVRLVHFGGTVSIEVEVKNEGTVAETFNVTAYYDAIAISTKTVINLAANTSLTLTFSWSTKNVTDGNYIMSATVDPVLGEVDIIDNTFVDGTVQVQSNSAVWLSGGTRQDYRFEKL